jgi:hypothetical protein
LAKTWATSFASPELYFTVILLILYACCKQSEINMIQSQVIDTIKEGGFSATSSAAIFDDCRLLATGFREITFEHCNREANEVAHELVRHSFHDRIDCIWDDDPLCFFLLSS